MFSTKEVQQLKEMHRKEFGKKINDEQIVECAQVLLDLLTAVYKPNKKYESDN